MIFKRIFKFSYFRILLTLAIYILLPIIPLNVSVTCTGPIKRYFSIVGILRIGLREGISLDNIIVPLLSLLTTYITISFIAYINNKLNIYNSIKNYIRSNKYSKIIFILGMTTLPEMVISYISGIYGGISNFPKWLTSIHNILEFYGVLIALPFSFITFILFKVNNLILTVVLNFTQIYRYPYADMPSDLADSSVAIIIIILVLIIIEWFLISKIIKSLISSIIKRFKSKSTKNN